MKQVLICVFMPVVNLALRGLKLCPSNRKDLKNEVLTAFLSADKTWTNPTQPFKIAGNYFVFLLEWRCVSVVFASRS